MTRRLDASTQSAPPVPRTRLIGREAERDTARSLLLQDAVPLVTLTGPGGSGKTRLALAVAAEVGDRFADGVTWVDLAPIADPTLLPRTVANALGLARVSQEPIEDQISRHVRSRQVLLLFDNCEHLVDAVADLIAPLLADCPALQILATSRSPLRIRGEYELHVLPLAVPDHGLATNAQLKESPAIQLFLERARAVNAGELNGDNALKDIAAICRSVDGLPLAIELAAARVRALSPAALRARLQHRLPLLEGGPRDAPARQRTIRNTVAWSYDLLTKPEQALFQQLAVFSGGFTIEAAQSVAGTDASPALLTLLERLAEHHLIQTMPSAGEPRFTMLETIREYGLERLTVSGEREAEACYDRHAAYFLNLVDELDAFWAPFMPNARQILDRLEVEYANLRSALGWLRNSGDVAGLLELAGKLLFFWQLRGNSREGQEWLEWGLLNDAEVPGRARAAAQIALAGVLYQQAEFERALELCDECLVLLAEDGDAAGVAHVYECAIPAAYNAGQFDRSASYLEHALAALARVGNPPWLVRYVSHVEYQRGVIAFMSGQFDTAERLLAQTVETRRLLAEESGVELAFACWPFQLLGMTNTAVGQRAQALSWYQAALQHAWRFQEQDGVVAALTSVASTLAAEGRWPEAAQIFGAVEAYCERCGYSFREFFWLWARVLGLPEPWQRGDEPFGRMEGMRAAIVAYGATPLPPLPDPAAADEQWAVARGIPIEVAVDFALAVDLAAPPAARAVFPISGEAKRGTNHELSPREQDVLALLCQRMTDPQIAERLFLSPRTVESHVSSILGKLEVGNRRDAAAAAVRLGLV